MRFRNVFLCVGGVLTLLILLLSDPDGGMVQSLPFGAGTLSTLIILVTSILYIGLLHLGRKALLDYLELDALFRKAIETSEGSAKAIIGVGLIMISIALVIIAATI